MYSFESRIRYSETDSNGRLRLTSLIDYFQDCTTFHSEDLGLGVGYMKENNLIWVLSGWQIVIHEMPKLGDYVDVVTFPYEFKAFMGNRNFALYGKDKTVYALGNSLWSLLSLETKKPVMPNELMLEKYVLEPPLEMDYAPRKIAVPAGGEKKDPIVVVKHHLDTNNHVNNGQYIRMAQTYLPEDFEICQMRAEYKKQAFLNDTLIPVVTESDSIVLVSLQSEDGKPYVTVEFTGKIAKECEM